MPPPKLAKPEFSPYGRYLIDVDARHESRSKGEKSVFHDTENVKETCGLEGIDTGSMSRFNNLNWALGRGYIRCPECK